MRLQLGKSGDDTFWGNVEKLYSGSPSHCMSDLRLRWCNHLSPTNRRSTWTANEDAALLRSLNSYSAAHAPIDWAEVAAAVTAADASDTQLSQPASARTPADCIMR